MFFIINQWDMKKVRLDEGRLAMTLLLYALLILVVVVCSTGCGGGGIGVDTGSPYGGGSSTGETTVENNAGGTIDPNPEMSNYYGSVKDGAGEGIAGALVLSGSRSVFTDEWGYFEITAKREAENSVTIVASGYMAANAVLERAPAISMIQLDEDHTPEQCPDVEIIALKTQGPGVLIKANISPFESDELVDVRGVIPGADREVILTKEEGNIYSGVIPEREGAALVIAIDDKGRHREALTELPDETTSSRSDGKAGGIRESWVGNVYGIHKKGYNHGQYNFNTSIRIAENGSIDAFGAFLQLPLLEAGQSSLIVETFTGSAKMAGQNQFLTLENEKGSISLKLAGKMKDDRSSCTGTINGLIEGKAYSGRFYLVNRKSYPNPWNSGKLSGSWGLSFYHQKQQSLNPPDYQYNMRLGIDKSGKVVSGSPSTLGISTSEGARLTFVTVRGENIGYFTGAPGIALNNGTGYEVYGLLGLWGWRMNGLWSIPHSGSGIFWGMRNLAWTAEDFDAQWQGYFKVTTGPDAGRFLNAQLNINQNGRLKGEGSLVAKKGSSLRGGNITIKEGSLTFSNPACGGVKGSFSGTQKGRSVIVEMSSSEMPEMASMGVWHGRLIGKFSISTNGDTGYYFLNRNSHK